MLQSESNCNTLIKLIKLQKDKPEETARGGELGGMRQRVAAAVEEVSAL